MLSSHQPFTVQVRHAVPVGTRPPLALPARPAWQEDAACRDLPWEEADRLFYPDGKAPAETMVLCNSCDVRTQCGTYGSSDVYGTWGGVTSVQRAANRAPQQT